MSANLTDLEIFAAVDPAQLAVIQTNMRPLAFDAGDEMVSEGLTTRGPLLVVTSGELEVSRMDAKGKRRALARIESPALVGEMEFLVDHPSSATVTARTDVRGFLLPRARFEALFAEGNAAAYHLAYEIGRVVSRRLAMTNELLCKALAHDEARLETVQRAQVDDGALAKIDAELDALLEG